MPKLKFVNYQRFRILSFKYDVKKLDRECKKNGIEEFDMVETRQCYLKINTH